MLINRKLVSDYLISKYNSKTQWDFKIHKYLNLILVSYILSSFCFLFLKHVAKVTIRVIYWSREKVKFSVIHWTANSAGQDLDVQG
jgi:hypothetical protein